MKSIDNILTPRGESAGRLVPHACWLMAALMSSTSLSAQQVPAGTPPPGAGKLEEVVVTAQRRRENVQKSSLDIQVLGAAQLARAGVSTAKDLSALVPGLQISLGANETQAFIRGVGDLSSTGLGQSAVAFNFDGIYGADQASYAPLFYDVARVEVLKGPQGTLYGRNASAGAINVVSNRPTKTLSGYLTAEFGNYDLKHVTGAISGPVTDTLSIRGAFNYIDRNGYLSDGTDDDKQSSGRVSALWTPSEVFTAFITADFDHYGGKGPGTVLAPTQRGNNDFTGAINAADNATILANAGPLAPLLALPGAGKDPLPFATDLLLHDTSRDNDQRNISADFTYDLGFAKLDLLPAYRDSNDRSFSYTPGFPFGDDETIHQYSSELRLSRTTDFIKVAAGLYYFNENDQLNQYAGIAPLVPPLNSLEQATLNTQSYAAFGQATISITPTFRFIGGLRYTDEDRTIDGRRVLQMFGAPDIFVPYNGAANFHSVNFRTGAEYDLTPVNMLYGTISSGFKSGGFNTFQSSNGISNVYQPETLYSYEAGARNRFLDNRLQFNVEGFYWNYLNSQQSHLTYDPTGALQFETLNAATASIYGGDFDVAAQVTPDDTITFTLELLNTNFDDFKYDLPTPNYAAAATGCSASASSHAGFTTLNCSGKPLPRSPNYSGNFGYQHVFQLGDQYGRLAAGVNLDFQGRRYLAVDYIAPENVPAYVRTNLSLVYTSPNGKYEITGFVKNLTNEAVFVGSINAAVDPGFIYATVDSPRTYGVRLTAKF